MKSLAALGAAACAIACLWSGTASAALDPAAVIFKLPDQIPWAPAAPDAPSRQAMLMGDASKPGPYMLLIEWRPHHMSRPHFHSTARYALVVKGTWWVGTGTKYDPDATVPMPAGSFVTDLVQGIHFDGAKDEPTTILIVGEGPMTTTQAEVH